MSKKVAIIMGSDSDFPVVKSALTELKKYGVEFECRVMSAHRTPAEAAECGSSARWYNPGCDIRRRKERGLRYNCGGKTEWSAQPAPPARIWRASYHCCGGSHSTCSRTHSGWSSVLSAE